MKHPAEAFDIQFGKQSGGNGALVVALPVLGGAGVETLFHGAKPVGGSGGFRLFEQGDFLIGATREPVGSDLTAQTKALYARLLAAAGGRRLARVWNYVPKINDAAADGLENYRHFCAGRSLAFDEAFGGGAAHAHMPSASAVGGGDGELAVIFAATSRPLQHVENPEQVPAYRYPREHGPRSPSFARATRTDSAGRPWVFISGTAAIKGHATLAPGDLAGQIDCTLDNLRVISRACGLGDRLGADSGENWERHFKVYLRRAEDYAKASTLLSGALLRPSDRVAWLKTDICRAALEIEIEATLIRGE